MRVQETTKPRRKSDNKIFDMNNRAMGWDGCCCFIVMQVALAT